MLLILCSLIALVLLLLGLSTRFRALVARRLTIFVVAMFVIVGAALFFGFAPDFFTIDMCLDRGGRWDKERKICQYAEPQHNKVR